MPNDHSWRMLTQEGIAEAGLERENVRDPAWLLAFLRGIPRAGFGVDLSVYPRLLAAERVCQELPAFTAAAPEGQPDAKSG
jgi:hypothetical protein